jgi:hypothetical protein
LKSSITEVIKSGQRECLIVVVVSSPVRSKNFRGVTTARLVMNGFQRINGMSVQAENAIIEYLNKDEPSVSLQEAKRRCEEYVQKRDSALAKKARNFTRSYYTTCPERAAYAVRGGVKIKKERLHETTVGND